MSSLFTPELGIIFWHSVIFLSSLFVLGKYAWNPILDAIEKQEKINESDIEKTKFLRQEIEVLNNKKGGIIFEAEKERDSILAKARNTEKELLESAYNKSEELRASELEKTRTEISLLREKAYKQWRKELVDLTINATSKLLYKELSRQGEHDAVINRIVDSAQSDLGNKKT